MFFLWTPVLNVVSQSLSIVKPHDPILLSFDLMPACDEQTDGQVNLVYVELWITLIRWKSTIEKLPK